MENYQIVKYLSAGVQGQISLAKDKRTNKLVVLKRFFIKPEIVEDFAKNEIISVKKLKSYDNSYIPIFYETFVHSNERYLSLEYIDGTNLEDFIERFNYIDTKTFFFIAIQILLGLKYIHSRNIIHNDLAPRNLMITQNHQIKFIDFGWACEYIPLKPIIWNSYNVVLDVTTQKFIGSLDPLITDYNKIETNKEYVIGQNINNKNIYESQPATNKTEKLLTTCSHYGNYDVPPEIVYKLRPDSREYIDKFYFGRDVWAASVIFYQIVNKNRYPFNDISNANKIPYDEFIAKMKESLKIQFTSSHYDKKVNEFIEFMLKVDWKSRPTIENGIDYLNKNYFSKFK